MKNIKLGNKLREIRKKHNLKQSEIAELTDLNVKTIQRYEKGENISKKFLYLLATKLKLEQKELFELLKIFDILDEEKTDNLFNYLEEIYKILGYEFSFYTTKNDEEYEMIKDNNTGKMYLSENSCFIVDYKDVFISFLNSLVNKEIFSLKEINQKDLDFLDSKEYKEILDKYSEPLFDAFSDELFKNIHPEEKKFKRWSKISYNDLLKMRSKEIEELKNKFTNKSKNKDNVDVVDVFSKFGKK